MPFSKGSRACPGQNMAMMELKPTTAAMILQLETGLAETTTEDSMSMIDQFIAILKAGRCELTFKVCT